MYLFQPHTFYILCGGCSVDPDCIATRSLPRFQPDTYAAAAAFIAGSGIEKGPLTVIFTGGDPLSLEIEGVRYMLEIFKFRLVGHVHCIFETCRSRMTREWMELIQQYGVTLDEVNHVRRSSFPSYMSGGSCVLMERRPLAASNGREIDWQISYNMRVQCMERDKIREDMLYADLIPFGLTNCAYADHYVRLREQDVLHAYYRMIQKYRQKQLDRPDVYDRHLFLLEDVCRSYFGKRSSCCTFSDCLGERCAITGDGGVYPCPRGAYRMEEPLVNCHNLGLAGDVLSHDRSFAQLCVENSPVWKELCQRKDEMKAGCSRCENYAMCRGGCVLDARQCDPPHDIYCAAYQKLFYYVRQVMTFGSPEQKKDFDAFAGRGNSRLDRKMGEKGAYSRGYAIDHGRVVPTDLDPFRKEPIRRALFTECDFRSPWLSGKQYGTLFLHMDATSSPDRLAALCDEAGLEGFQELVLYEKELALLSDAEGFLKSLQENNARWMHPVLSVCDAGGLPQILKNRYFDEFRYGDPCAHCHLQEAPYGRFVPKLSCGLGFNLSVDPAGKTSPCDKMVWLEGLNVLDRSLAETMNTKLMTAFRRCDVDSNETCRRCQARYLCGGPCKGYIRSISDLDAPDFDCEERKSYFTKVLSCD